MEDHSKKIVWQLKIEQGRCIVKYMCCGLTCNKCEVL